MKANNPNLGRSILFVAYKSIDAQYNALFMFFAGY